MIGASTLRSTAHAPKRLKVSGADRNLLAEHVLRLFELAKTHREFASSADQRGGCHQTPANALVAAKRAERLATLISNLMIEHTGWRPPA